MLQRCSERSTERLFLIVISDQLAFLMNI
ncbi:hypothetical protein BsWGS_23404 [Bradybaena similaris]